MRGDLDWIALQSLEKERARCYDNPKELAEDVQRFSETKSIAARPPSFV